MYYRIQHLPEKHREEFIQIYNSFLPGGVSVRDDLGDCYQQALEFTKNNPSLFKEELKRNLRKVQFFYAPNDERRHSIETFINNLKFPLEIKPLQAFFKLEADTFNNIFLRYNNNIEIFLQDMSIWLNKQSGQARNSMDNILSECERILEFIVTQIDVTKYSSKLHEDDHAIEAKIFQLVSNFSVILINLLEFRSRFSNENFNIQVISLVTRLLQSTLIVRNPKDSSGEVDKGLFYKQLLKTHSNLKFEIDFIAPMFVHPQALESSKVRVMIVNEKIAQKYHSNPESIDVRDNCGELSQLEQKFEENTERNVLTAKFSSLNLKKIKRAEKKCTNTVTDEKFVFIFTTEIRISDICVKVHSYSLPVVVIVHVNQEASGQGTMIWDNTFGAFNRRPFDVPEGVHYSEIAKILNNKFFYSTGKGLTLDNLKHIGEEKFHILQEPIVTMKSFLKDHMPQCKFSFWEWFHEINKLVVNCFKDTWRKGLVEGFISKMEAEERFVGKPEGTFLLRFSDSQLGTLLFYNNLWQHPYYVANDFKNQKIDEAILQNASLKFLFPDQAKENVFFFDTSQQSRGKPDYVKPRTYTFIEKKNKSGDFCEALSPANTFISAQSSSQAMSPSAAVMNGGGSHYHQPSMSPSMASQCSSDYSSQIPLNGIADHQYNDYDMSASLPGFDTFQTGNDQSFMNPTYSFGQ